VAERNLYGMCMNMGSGAARTVLIVEDEDAIRELLIEVLTEEGYAAHGVENGAVALAYLAENAVPDLVLLDLMMPVVDGWTVLEVMRADPRWIHIPVIVVSASGQTFIRQAVGANAYVPKPVCLDRLVHVIRRLPMAGEVPHVDPIVLDVHGAEHIARPAES
jgi:CheY-like chemotaxis protein